MPTWIVIIALLSIAATAGLTWILTRINQPAKRRGRGGEPVFAESGGSHRDRNDADVDAGDSGGDGGGGGD